MKIRDEMTFQQLVEAVTQVHHEMASQAGRAVNLALTARNWLIGMHIAEFELQGSDRADYGERIYTALAESLTQRGVSNCIRRQLYRYTRFYQAYLDCGCTARTIHPLDFHVDDGWPDCGCSAPTIASIAEKAS